MSPWLKRNALLGTAILAGAFVLSPAIAAEPAFVSKLGGKGVSVMKGSETSTVQVQSLLAAGDRVSVGSDSFVDVKYLSDGCTIRVSAGNSLVVGPESPCAASAQNAAAPDAKTDMVSSLPAEAKIVPAAVDASAQVAGQSGSITRVNRGTGLVDVTVGEGLAVGDTVFAGPGSTVTLYFPAAGCSYMVAEETYFQVPATPPCTAGTAASNGAGTGTVREEAALTVTDDDDDDDKAAAALMAGALVVGGGVLAVIALSGDDENNDNPATPD